MRFHRGGGIKDDLFKHREIVEIAPAAVRADATERLRTLLLEALTELEALRARLG